MKPPDLPTKPRLKRKDTKRKLPPSRPPERLPRRHNLKEERSSAKSLQDFKNHSRLLNKNTSEKSTKRLKNLKKKKIRNDLFIIKFEVHS